MFKRILSSLFILFSLTLAADAANRFAVCATTCTWDASNTAMWSTATGGATGASVPVNGDVVTMDGATCVGGTTCTITVNTDFTIGSLAMGTCTASTTGCILDFSVNNNNPTFTGAAGFSGSGTGTRNLKMGNGTWTFTNSGSVWTMTSASNLTFNAGSSTLLFTAGTGSTRTFATAALTYATVTIAANSSSGYFIFSSTGSTIGTLNVSAPNLIQFDFGSHTINSINWNGNSTSQIFVGSNSAVTNATITTASGTPVMTWLGLRSMTFSGGATFKATNSFDLGQNVGITVTSPGSGGGACILGGWLLWRDLAPNSLPGLLDRDIPANDNSPAFLDKAG